MNRFLSFPAYILFWFLALSFLVSCGGDEPIDPTPVTPVNPNPPTPEKDTTAPTITVAKSTLNVISGPSLTISGNEMKIGNDLVASWKDDKSTSCTVSITFVATDGTSKTVNSGDKLSEEGKLKVKVSDEAGNSSEAEITLTKTDSQAPEISIKIQEKNVIAGVKVVVDGSQLYFDDQVAATWKDDFSETCKVEISLVPDEGESRAINSGDTIKDSGKLLIQVKDDNDNKATGEIKLTKTDSQAPTITLLIQEKNVITGVKVLIDGNQLLFNEQVAASWTDDFTETCSAQLRLDGHAINSGDVLQEAGKLVIAVSDDFKNEATAEIVLTAEAIYGLEGLKNLSLQVDNEVNLLQGITYANGVSLDKVEIEAQGNRFVVQDPNHYVPETPGTIDLIITVNVGSKTLEFRVDSLEVKGLDYNAPKMATANLIVEQYPWFNNLTQWYNELWYDQSVWNNKKNFVYPHILVSYITGERYRWNNIEYIIVGEIPASYECEDVWPDGSIGDWHADGWYLHIKNMTPFATIKASGWCWQYVIHYVSKHPEKNFMLSCACDNLGGWTVQDLRWCTEEYEAIKELLQMENVIVSVASWNVTQARNKRLNENEKEQEMWNYSSASVNSEKNNKITVPGFNPAKNNIYWEDHESARPIWFDNMRWNILMPFTDLVDNYGNNLISSTSSMPTATLSSTLGNYLSIIMHNHPWTTLEDANTVMQERYLRAERFKYKDPDDGKIKDGEHWHFIDSDKFIREEILYESEVRSTLLGTPHSLPSSGGLYYEGKGIQFIIDGQTYDMTEENRTTLENAVKTGKEITWTYNSDRAKKYGVTGDNTITVRVMDRQTRLIPDISLQVQVR